jgi:hypothetical protein
MATSHFSSKITNRTKISNFLLIPLNWRSNACYIYWKMVLFGGCKVSGQEGGLGVTSHAPRCAKSAKSVREWTLTLPNELPLWELESKWTPKSSKCNCRGQNPSVWKKKNYNIRNILKHRCLKWARMTHLDIYNRSYDQNKGWKSNWQFDSWPLKVKNRPNFLAFKHRVTYNWKAFDQSYNFSSDPIAIEGLHAKLWAPKVAGVPVVGISGLPGQNAIWMWPPGRIVENTIRSGPWWVLWIQVRPWLILTLKMLKICINQHVVWFVQIWMSE